MSLFSMLNDFDEDPIFGSHMRTMRHMNTMMNSFFSDPMFMTPALGFGARTPALSPFGAFPAMPNINRLLGGSLGSLNSLNPVENGHSYSSSTVVSMTSGPDGRPQVYKATSSTRSAPGGVCETQKTVCDSRTGTKKMAIGHHIGDRAHIIEREQNLHSGDQEERQDFINLDEDEADDFNREWQTRTKSRSEIPRITAAAHRFPTYSDRHGYGTHLPAITAGSSRRQSISKGSQIVAPRRSLRAVNPQRSTSTSRRPYSPPNQPQPKKSKNIKTASGSPPSPDM